MKVLNKLILGAAMIVIALACGSNSIAQTQSTFDGNQPLAAEQNQNFIFNSTRPARFSALEAKRVNSPERPNSGKNAAGDSSTAPAATSQDDQWHFSFTPYFWLAGVTGHAGIGNRVVEVESGLTDPNVHLNFGFMSTFEARRDKLLILTDLQYSNLGTERPNPGILFSSATAAFKTFILDPEVGYRVAENTEKGRSVDLLGGIRYWHLRTDLDFAAGALPAESRTASRGWVDGVAGVRGQMHLTPKLFMVGKGDIGGGGSHFTYQLLGGFGYQIAQKFALVGGYRALHVDYDKDNLLFDTTLHGPIVGVRIGIN